MPIDAIPNPARAIVAPIISGYDKVSNAVLSYMGLGSGRAQLQEPPQQPQARKRGFDDNLSQPKAKGKTGNHQPKKFQPIKKVKKFHDSVSSASECEEDSCGPCFPRPNPFTLGENRQIKDYYTKAY
jgi:hypothetical protein